MSGSGTSGDAICWAPGPAERHPRASRLRVEVCGSPTTQGSAKGFVVQGRNGKARAAITHDNQKLMPWRRAIVRACVEARAKGDPYFGIHEPLFTGPVAVLVEFVLPRLAKHPKTTRGGAVGWPASGLDLDKLQRAVGDALVPLVLKDDNLVCQWNASKRYAAIGEQPGAVIEVVALE